MGIAVHKNISPLADTFPLIHVKFVKIRVHPKSPLADTQYIVKTFFYEYSKNKYPRRAHH